MKELLVEKYRPKELSDVIGCPAGLDDLIRTKNIPHLLFEGVQGSGKTTIAKIIMTKLDTEVLLLNASKDRGIDVIRNIIEPFAKKKSDKIKIVFLDEFDSTTPQFQTALRNFMETYATSTRFIATCNYVNKIIQPIQSRFSVYTFGNYKDEDIKKRLNYIITQENIQIEEDVVDTLIKKYKDDIRSMINFLDKNKHIKITSSMIGDVNMSLYIIKRILKKEWYQLRQEIVNKNLDYISILEEIDSIIFRASKIDISKKQKVNQIIARGMYEMYFSLNKEICFSSTLAKIQEVF